ncbi:MAG: heme NO-binding domain-containing protein [Magnetococcales bacterium]|nr:heme NO-binding domain-containing protein [Magnetococcales bacterium]
MNGLIFLALDDFLESRLGSDAWLRAMDSAGLEEQDFNPEYFYPDQVASELFTAVAAQLDLPLEEMLEQFGRHLVPGLIAMGRSMGVVDKSWKTIDIIEHLHDPILESFSNKDEGILPPGIRTYRLKHSEVAIAYVSKRRLCHLLKGIVMGLGEFFEEPVLFKERVCMLHSKAPLCRLSVFIDDPELVRYVDIKREFAIVHSRIDELTFYCQVGGVPFSSKGLVLQFSDKEVVVQAPKEQLAAMAIDGKCYIAVSHLAIGLRAVVKEIELAQGFATLHNIEMTDGAVGQRCFKRVEPVKQFPITIDIEGKESTGKVLNISAGGVKVVLQKWIELDETFLFVPIVVKFTLPLKWVQQGDTVELGPQNLVLDANIVDVFDEDDYRAVRIMFSPLTGRELFLMDQYYQRCLEDAEITLNKRLDTIRAK